MGWRDDDDEVLMRDDVPRAGLITTHTDKKERRNEKREEKHKRQSAPWCWRWCSCAKKPSSSVERPGPERWITRTFFGCSFFVMKKEKKKMKKK